MKQRKLAPNIPLPEYEHGSALETEHIEQSVPAQPTARTRLPVERRLVSIPVGHIDPNPYAPRQVYTPRMILERAEALRSQGQHDPIHVIPCPDAADRYIIADGWTRVLACVQHKVFDTLLAEVHHGLTIQEAAWFGYEQNEERNQHCDLDRAFFYEKLLALGLSATEIVRRAKISNTQMTFYRSFARLPEDVLEIIRSQPEKFGATAAYHLQKLCEKRGPRHAITLAVRFAEENRTHSWLVSQVQQHVVPAKRRINAPQREIRYENGYYKQRGDRFEISMSVEDSDKVQAFADALERLLESVAVAPKDSLDV